MLIILFKTLVYCINTVKEIPWRVSERGKVSKILVARSDVRIHERLSPRHLRRLVLCLVLFWGYTHLIASEEWRYNLILVPRECKKIYEKGASELDEKRFHSLRCRPEHSDYNFRISSDPQQTRYPCHLSHLDGTFFAIYSNQTHGK